MTDGYDSPVGSLAERCGADVLPGAWNVGLGYGRYYLLSGKFPAIHTGADIALEPYGGYGQPVYAVADGIVTCSRDVTGTTWRNLVVVNHGGLCSRYAHLRVRTVRVGDSVLRGQQIGELGNADGAFAPHLHFDLAPGDTLVKFPTNWPGDNIAVVRQLYVDPIAFIKGHRPMFEDQVIALAKQIETLAESHKSAPPPPVVTTPMWIKAGYTGVRVRALPATGDTPILKLLNGGDEIGAVDDTSEPDGWTKIATPVAGHVSSQYLTVTRPNL